MNQKSLQLDERRRQVTVGDRISVLPEKSWQVLSMLVESAPETVGRADIINNIWRGNFLVGEKGLNQAMWSIRAALTDDSTKPRYIRTIPRVGYQWVYSDLPVSDKSASPFMRGLVVKLTSMSVVAISFGVAVFQIRDATVVDAPARQNAVDVLATSAYRVNEDIHVQFASGCVGIMRGSKIKEIGSPLLSEDGREVAVTVQEAGKCRLVTIDLASRELRDFGSCPVI